MFEISKLDSSHYSMREINSGLYLGMCGTRAWDLCFSDTNVYGYWWGSTNMNAHNIGRWEIKRQAGVHTMFNEYKIRERGQRSGFLALSANGCGASAPAACGGSTHVATGHIAANIDPMYLIRGMWILECSNHQPEDMVGTIG